MPLTGEEIRARLTAFAARWSVLLQLNREIAAGEWPYAPFG